MALCATLCCSVSGERGQLVSPVGACCSDTRAIFAMFRHSESPPEEVIDVGVDEGLVCGSDESIDIEIHTIPEESDARDSFGVGVSSVFDVLQEPLEVFGLIFHDGCGEGAISLVEGSGVSCVLSAVRSGAGMRAEEECGEPFDELFGGEVIDDIACEIGFCFPFDSLEESGVEFLRGSERFEVRFRYGIHSDHRIPPIVSRRFA